MMNRFCSIGSSRDCDIIISLEGVKPVHCQLELSCGEVFLTDLSHCNTNESQLSTGDVFTVMGRHFRMESNHSYLQPILNDTAQPLDVMVLNRQPEQTEIALQTGSVGRPAQQFEMDDTGELGDNQPMLDGDDATQPDDVMSLNRQPKQTEIALQTGSVGRLAQQFEMDDTGELGDNQPMLNGDDATQPDDVMPLNRQPKQTEIALQTGSVGRPAQQFEMDDTGELGDNQPMLDGDDATQTDDVMPLNRQPKQTEIALQTGVERPAQEFEMDDTGELGDNQPMLDGDDATQPVDRQPEQTEIALQTGSVGRPAQQFEVDNVGQSGDNQPMLDGDDTTQPVDRQPEQTEIALQTGVGRPAQQFEMDDTGELGDNQPMLDGDDATQPDDVMPLNRQPEQTEIALQTGSVGRPAQEFEINKTGHSEDNQPMLDGNDTAQWLEVISLNRQPKQTEIAQQTGSVGRPAQQFEVDNVGQSGDNQPMLDGDDTTQPVDRQPEQTEIALQTGVGRPAQQFEINNTGHSEDNQPMLDGNDTAQWLEVISLNRQPEQTEIALQTGVERPAQEFEMDDTGELGDNQPMLDGDDATQPDDVMPLNRQPKQTEIALQTGSVGRPAQEFEMDDTGELGDNQPMLDGDDATQPDDVMPLNRQPEQTEIALQTGVERPAQEFEMDDTGELGDNQPMLDGDDATQPVDRQPEQTEISLQTGVGRPAQQFEINNTGHSEDNQPMLDGNDTAQWLEVISLKRQPEQTEIAQQTGSVGRPAQQFEVDNVGQSGDNQPMLDGDDTTQPVDRQPEQTEIALQTGVGRPAQQFEMDDTGELGDNQPMLDGDDATQPDDVMSLKRQPKQTEIALQTGSVGRPAQQFEMDDTGQLGDNQPMLDGDDATQPDDVMSLNRQPEQTKIALQAGAGIEADQFVSRATKNKSGKHKLDKSQACFYCQKLVLKIGRHLQECHKDTVEIQKIAALKERKNKKYLQELDKLKCLGNFNYNVKVLSDDQPSSHLIVAKRPTKLRPAADFTPCPHCYGFYVCDELWRHILRCSVYLEGETNCNSNRLSVLASSRLILEGAIIQNKGVGRKFSELKSQVLIRARMDAFYNLMISDELIMMFGTVLLKKLGPGKKSDIIQRMRQIARLLAVLNERAGNENTELSCFISPDNFDKVISATEELCGLQLSSDGRRMFERPSLALRLGHLLNKVSHVKVGVALRSKDHVSKSEAEDFRSLHKAEWTDTISSNALNSLKRKQDQEVCLLPLTEDLIKLRECMKVGIQTFCSQLQESPHYQIWRKLAQYVMTRLILFNKRRGGEVSRLLLKTYLSKPDWNENVNQELASTLSPLEKKLLKRMDLLQIPGKRNRKVPLLLTEEVQVGLQVLADRRNQCSIAAQNPYVFASKSSNGYLESWQAMSMVANSAELIRPQLVTSTRLRKYNATVCQVVDMSPVETEWLSNHMGHSLNIHKNFYRLHDSVIEMAKVSRLLMAVDEGDVSKYHGKSLQDINIKDMTIGEESDVDAESDTEDSSLNKQLAYVQQSEDEGLIIQTTEGMVSDNDSDDDGFVYPAKRKRSRVLDSSSDEEESQADNRGSSTGRNCRKPDVLDSSSDEEESQADNRGSSTGRNCRKPDGRASWTTQEISVLQKNFSHSIEQGQYPFSRSIQALIDRGLLSKGRTVLTVKAKLQNLMKKKK